MSSSRPEIQLPSKFSSKQECIDYCVNAFDLPEYVVEAYLEFDINNPNYLKSKKKSSKKKMSGRERRYLKKKNTIQDYKELMKENPVLFPEEEYEIEGAVEIKNEEDLPPRKYFDGYNPEENFKKLETLEGEEELEARKKRDEIAQKVLEDKKNKLLEKINSN